MSNEENKLIENSNEQDDANENNENVIDESVKEKSLEILPDNFTNKPSEILSNNSQDGSTEKSSEESLELILKVTPSSSEDSPKESTKEFPIESTEESTIKSTKESPIESPKGTPEDSTDEDYENEYDTTESKVIVRKTNKNKQLKRLTTPFNTQLMEENAIFQAILSDNYNLVKVLLEDGNISANIIWRGTGETALHTSIKKDNIEIFHLLIKHGADINACISQGKNCLYFASGKNNYEMVEYMCKIYQKNAGPNNKWKEGYAGLFAASAMGNERIVNLLISSGVDLKARTYGFLTPLHVSVERGYLKIAEILLQRGFDVNETTAEGYTVLHYAVKRESIVLIKMLLDAGADMTIKSLKNESSFFLAIHTGNLEIVKTFIDYGANVNKF